MNILVWPPQAIQVRAQVVFGHPASGSWSSFRQEAIALAEHGVRSCLIQFGRGASDLRDGRGEARFREECIEIVLEAARSLARTSPAPIHYVGKNLGAFVGGLVASRPSPIGRFVFAAGVPDLTRFYLRSTHPVAVRARKGVSQAALKDYERLTRALNPVATLPKAGGKEVFFQWASHDDWIPRRAALECSEASAGSKKVRFYDTDHDFECLQARQDRLDFLVLPSAQASPMVHAVR